MNLERRRQISPDKMEERVGLEPLRDLDLSLTIENPEISQESLLVLCDIPEWSIDAELLLMAWGSD